MATAVAGRRAMRLSLLAESLLLFVFRHMRLSFGSRVTSLTIEPKSPVDTTFSSYFAFGTVPTFIRRPNWTTPQFPVTDGVTTSAREAHWRRNRSSLCLSVSSECLSEFHSFLDDYFISGSVTRIDRQKPGCRAIARAWLRLL
jgi:hypothetical protein